MRALAGDPDTFMQVAEDEGEVIGHVWAALRLADGDAGREMIRDASLLRLTVHWLGVAATHRRRGVASRLLQSADTWGIAQGARAAGFSAFIGASTAISFYEQRMGYRRQAVHLHKPLS